MVYQIYGESNESEILESFINYQSTLLIDFVCYF